MGCDSSYQRGGPLNDGYGFYVHQHTDMLCSILTAVENGTAEKLLKGDAPVAVWWRRHKQKDDKDRAAEAADKARTKLAKRAKKKLTKDELEALGIRDLK